MEVTWFPGYEKGFGFGILERGQINIIYWWGGQAIRVVAAGGGDGGDVGVEEEVEWLLVVDVLGFLME